MKLLAFLVDAKNLNAVNVELDGSKKLYDMDVVRTVTNTVSETRGIKSKTKMELTAYSPDLHGEIPRSFTVRDLKKRRGLFLVWPENPDEATKDELDALKEAFKIQAIRHQGLLLVKDEELERLRKELSAFQLKRPSTSSSSDLDSKVRLRDISLESVLSLE